MTTNDKQIRVAVLPLDAGINRVERYLPSNYKAKVEDGKIFIVGLDEAGWTLDGYVIPRLASGLMFAKEITSLLDRERARAEQAHTDDDVTADRPDHDYCAWCGWSRVRDDSDEDALLLHIMECPKHPLRFGSSKRDAAIAARALRQAADAMESEPGVTFADALMIRWLRARAEQVGERGRKDRGPAGYSQEDQDNLGQCGR